MMSIKIGLLQCDQVAQIWQEAHGDYLQMFAAWLPGVHWERYDVTKGHFPASTGDCDAYLCTGSRHSVYDDLPWIRRLKELVQELDRQRLPFVGVCFGHQLLAEALGGKVAKAGVGWCVGLHTFRILHREPWMNPFQKQFSLLMSCQDQVVQLPADSTVLAETADCPVSMYQVGKHMLGIQAHPEFSKAYAGVLMESRRERIGEQKVKTALQSLQGEADSMLLAAWVQGFLRQ